MRLNLPLLDHRELEEVEKVLRTGYLTQGPKVAEFEELVKKMIGVKYAFSTSSCTTALHLSLAALNIKPGDEVLVQDYTFPATANVVVQLGAIPVFVDINLDTFTIDLEDLERKLSPKTRAIIPVDTFGCSVDMDPINEMAARYNIPVLEDAACAFGTTYKDRYCGNLSAVGCFSFHPRKAITTGEGGMILTNDGQLAERIALLRSHGGVRTGYWFEYEDAGFNYRMSDIQGAIGIAQMEKLPYILGRKTELARALTERLSAIKGIRTPVQPAWGGHVYQSYVILVDETIDRDDLIHQMRSQDIECTIGTYACHDQPFFQRTYGYRTGELKNSHAAFTRSVALPFYPQQTDADLDRIQEALGQVINKQ